jgi:hypothetical protein
MNLLKAVMHHVNSWTSWKFSGGATFVIVDTISGLGLIPHQETIYLSNFSKGTSNVHFSGFSFILNFLRLSKVSARLDMNPSASRVFMTMSSM